jgi:hypothetical protein
MAFHGDCSSYPVPDLLQWLDASRKTGALTLTWDAGQRKIFLLSGQIVATASSGLWERLARVMEHGDEAPGGRVMGLLRSGQATEASVDMSVRQLAEDELIGALVALIAAQSGTFHWTEDPDRGGDEWVSLERPLRQALFEALRLCDEQHDVERALPTDHLVLEPKEGPAPGNALHRIIVHLARREQGLTLSRLWLSLGLSRGVALRAVYDLVRANRLTVVGGTSLEADPIADMLEKGAVLLRERQFDAAGLVFTTLMQRDPGDRRVREFARLAEREHVAALYAELPPVTTFEVVHEPSTLSALRPEERTLVAHLQSGWDVSSVVLASSQRELDTLKSMTRLLRMGVLRATS